MISKTDNIILVMVCDNHFSVMLAALLKSIEVNQDGTNQITIYIVDDGISRGNHEKLNSIISANNINLVWVPIKSAVPDKTRFPVDQSTFPANVYARFFIPWFLPQNIHRAIYLDTDTLVLSDIKELWNVELNGLMIGAAVDLSETVSSDWGGVPNYQNLGIPPESKYFNSGVLVIDVEQWRKNNSTEAILTCIQDNIRYATFPDQYGLNVYFANRWFELNPLWNCYSQCNQTSPYIIHFTRMKPIYSGYQFNKEYAQKFYDFLALTPYKDFRPYSKFYRACVKLKQLIIKNRNKLNFINQGKTLSP